MAYHAGAELANLECFQINPLIKDYNGPACAYVCGPFGGYTANNRGERFIECDYWSGQMMLEFWNELQSGKGPVFLKLDHLHESTIGEIEYDPAQGRAAEPRALPRAARHRLPAATWSRCTSRRSASAPATGLGRVRRRARADHRARPLRRRRHGERAAQLHAGRLHERRGRRRGRGRLRGRGRPAPITTRPTSRPSGSACWPRPGATTAFRRNQVEYKARRLVNDYLQPPKVTRKMEIGQRRIAEVRGGSRDRDGGARRRTS